MCGYRHDRLSTRCRLSFSSWLCSLVFYPQGASPDSRVSHADCCAVDILHIPFVRLLPLQRDTVMLFHVLGHVVLHPEPLSAGGQTMFVRCHTHLGSVGEPFRRRCSMLTNADVCLHMLTYPDSINGALCCTILMIPCLLDGSRIFLFLQICYIYLMDTMLDRISHIHIYVGPPGLSYAPLHTSFLWCLRTSPRGSISRLESRPKTGSG